MSTQHNETHAQRQQITLTGASADYCYVRYRGVSRDATIKFFYHEGTLCKDVIERAKEFGEVRNIEFPRVPAPFTEAEYQQALAEGRVIIS